MRRTCASQVTFRNRNDFRRVPHERPQKATRRREVATENRSLSGRSKNTIRSKLAKAHMFQLTVRAGRDERLRQQSSETGTAAPVRSRGPTWESDLSLYNVVP